MTTQITIFQKKIGDTLEEIRNNHYNINDSFKYRGICLIGSHFVNKEQTLDNIENINDSVLSFMLGINKMQDLKKPLLYGEKIPDEYLTRHDYQCDMNSDSDIFDFNEETTPMQHCSKRKNTQQIRTMGAGTKVHVSLSQDRSVMVTSPNNIHEENEDNFQSAFNQLNPLFMELINNLKTQEFSR